MIDPKRINKSFFKIYWNQYQNFKGRIRGNQEYFRNSKIRQKQICPNFRPNKLNKKIKMINMFPYEE